MRAADAPRRRDAARRDGVIRTGHATIGPLAVFREAAAGLTAVRSRSLLALFGIVVGIGSVIAMISVGEVVKEESLKQFRALGTDIVTARTYYSQQRGRVITMPLDVVLDVAADLPEIAAAAAWSDVSGQVSYRGRPLDGTAVAGVTGSFPEVTTIEPAAGRFVSDLDFRQYFCVVGAAVAEVMRGRGGRELLGEKLRMQGRLWTVIGVLAPVSATPLRASPNESVYVPVTTAMLFNGKDSIGDLRARAAPGIEPERAARALVAWFKRRVPGIEFGAKTAEQLVRGMRRQSRLFTLLLAAVGTISLIVGAVGIMNVMLLSVSERRGEIGLRRAVGARRRDIRRQFLLESVLLCTAGGILGIGAGTAVAWGICAYAGWSFFVSLSAALSGLAVATGVGVFSGLYPAHRAATLDPIDALRK